MLHLHAGAVRRKRDDAIHQLKTVVRAAFVPLHLAEGRLSVLGPVESQVMVEILGRAAGVKVQNIRQPEQNGAGQQMVLPGSLICRCQEQLFNRFTVAFAQA